MNVNFLNIDNISVSGEIVNKKFACDLSQCKGACCTMESEYGAPIHKTEIEKIEKALHAAKKYLPKRSVNEIEKNGFWEEKEGLLMIRSIDNKDCVFVYRDSQNVALCGIEKAFYAGEVDFIKPLSCHLFPIRISDFGGPVLRYEEYDECKHALKNGQKKNITIMNFCEASLKRSFGEEWFDKLKEYTDK
ncbi:MAG: DUF3109 family protein [Chlorobi bacterium]|nr:DUF3109 family protein [Chlorobiota bacterium]